MSDYDYVRIFSHNLGPIPVSAAFVANGLGSGWDTGTHYSVRVGAWYHGSAEDDIYRVGAINTMYTYALAQAPMLADYSVWNNLQPANATDQLVVTWSLPPGLQPDHYTVYLQEIATYEYWRWAKRANAADIANTATTYTISSPVGALTTYEDVPIQTINGTYTLTVAGNRLIYCGANAVFLGDPGGAAVNLTVAGVGSSLSSAALSWNVRGVHTTIEFNEALTGVAQGELLRIYHKHACFGRGDLAAAAWGTYRAVNIFRPLNFEIEPLSQIVRTADGLFAAASLAQTKLSNAITLRFPGISCTYADWQTLNLWWRSQTGLWLVDINASETATSYGPVAQYLGRILALNNVGTLAKQTGEYSIIFGVEREQAQGQGLDWNA